MEPIQEKYSRVLTTVAEAIDNVDEDARLAAAAYDEESDIVNSMLGVLAELGEITVRLTAKHHNETMPLDRMARDHSKKARQIFCRLLGTICTQQGADKEGNPLETLWEVLQANETRTEDTRDESIVLGQDYRYASSRTLEITRLLRTPDDMDDRLNEWFPDLGYGLRRPRYQGLEDEHTRAQQRDDEVNTNRRLAIIQECYLSDTETITQIREAIRDQRNII